MACGDTDPDYAENGLRALLRLRSYRPSYRAVVNRLAKQIVEIAEKEPIDPVEPSRVPGIATMTSVVRHTAPLTTFDIEVAAPTAAVVSQDRDLWAYGETATQWRPFSGQELPLAEYARQITERFDADARVSEVSVPANADQRRPGIIVIDPEFVSGENGRATLKAVAEKIPRWVMPLVVLGKPGEVRTQELAAKAADILASAKALPTESARRAARGVQSLEDFVSIVPVLVAEAERQYLRYRHSRVPSPRSAGRPRLSRPKD